MALTERSKALFEAYARDAANWSGMSLVGGNVGRWIHFTEKGLNLTQLEVEGFLTTWLDDGCTWIHFTEKGLAYADELGIPYVRSEAYNG